MSQVVKKVRLVKLGAPKDSIRKVVLMDEEKNYIEGVMKDGIIKGGFKTALGASYKDENTFIKVTLVTSVYKEYTNVWVNPASELEDLDSFFE